VPLDRFVQNLLLKIRPFNFALSFWSDSLQLFFAIFTPNSNRRLQLHPTTFGGGGIIFASELPILQRLLNSLIMRLFIVSCIIHCKCSNLERNAYNPTSGNLGLVVPLPRRKRLGEGDSAREAPSLLRLCSGQV
jgi:hypothetical protein